MSETEHHKGVLIPTRKTLKEYAPEAKDSCDLPEYVIEIDGMVYLANNEKIDPYNDILNAGRLHDGTIDYEVRYYNGSCCFEEAIQISVNDFDKRVAALRTCN